MMHLLCGNTVKTSLKNSSRILIISTRSSVSIQETAGAFENQRESRQCQRIYSIACDFGKVCIGETGRTLKDTLGKHKRAATNGNMRAVHILNNNDHSIQWDEAKAVKQEQYMYISTRNIRVSQPHPIT